MFKRRLRFFLHRWHRRLGLVAALIVLLVSITGVLLNHTGELALAKHYPQQALWLWPYPQQQNSGYVLHDAVLYSSGEQVYLNQQVLDGCKPPLLGVVEKASDLWVLCSGQLLFLQQANLVENIDSSLLAQSLSAIALVDDEVFLSSGGQWLRLDENTLSLIPTQVIPERVFSTEILPAAYQQNRVISWQKVLQDLHSGRFFGHWGIYVVDAAALILVLLALSGFWIWYSRR